MAGGHVGSQRLFGVPHPFGKPQDLLGARAQFIDGAQGGERPVEVNGRRGQLAVLVQHIQGLATELLRLVAHLVQALALLGVQRDQPREALFELGQGRVDGGQVFLGETDCSCQGVGSLLQVMPDRSVRTCPARTCLVKRVDVITLATPSTNVNSVAQWPWRCNMADHT